MYGRFGLVWWGLKNSSFLKPSLFFRLSLIFGSSSRFSSFLKYLPFQVVFIFMANHGKYWKLAASWQD